VNVNDSTRRFLRNHSLSIILLSVLLLQTILYLTTVQPFLPKQDQTRFVISEYFLSILADTYGMLLIVLLSKWFFEKGSREVDKDADGGRD
jgi:hypothetical protein